MSDEHVSGWTDRICRQDVIVGVIGLRYAGLPLVLRFDQASSRVLGFDVDPRKSRPQRGGARSRV